MTSRRLNDTTAIVARGIRGGDSVLPDATGARFFRGPHPGDTIVEFSEHGEAEVRAVPGPTVGSECLRGAVAYLGGVQRR